MCWKNITGVYIDPWISFRTKADETGDETSGEDEDGDDTDSEAACSQNYYYLSNEDFKDGTLRIKECGTNTITEDIKHFNKPNDNVLNDIDWLPNNYLYEINFPWYPTLEQEFLDELKD